MTKRERLWKKVKTTIVNTKWTDSSLSSFAETALNCDECPAFANCDHTKGCCETIHEWLMAHGDEEAENRRMTNKEWLNTLSDEEFVEVLPLSCSGCPAKQICDETVMPCDAVIRTWLNQQHKEDESC